MSVFYFAKCVCLIITMISSAECLSKLLNSGQISQVRRRNGKNNEPVALLFDDDPNYMGHVDLKTGNVVKNGNKGSHTVLKALFQRLYNNKNNVGSYFYKNNREESHNVLREKVDIPNQLQQNDLKALKTVLSLRQETQCSQQQTCKQKCRGSEKGVSMQECLLQCTVTYKCGQTGVLTGDDADDCGGESNECGCKNKPNPSTRAPRNEDPNASWSQCC